MKKSRGKIKSVDLVVSKRWASGWYCRVQGRSFIILDDAEVDGFDHRDEYIAGIVEVVPETVEYVD